MMSFSIPNKSAQNLFKRFFFKKIPIFQSILASFHQKDYKGPAAPLQIISGLGS